MKEIKLNNGKVIKMRTPKVRDMRAVGDINNEVEKEMKLIGNLTNMTFEELDEMELNEYKKLQEALMGFLS
jgi:hypothetical protein